MKPLGIDTTFRVTKSERWMDMLYDAIEEAQLVGVVPKRFLAEVENQWRLAHKERMDAAMMETNK